MTEDTDSLYARIEELKDEIRDLKYELDDKYDAGYDAGYDEGYDAGYSDGKYDGATNKLAEFKEDILDHVEGVHRCPYGPPQTFQQVHGWVTHNGTFFGFGDTAEESMADYLRKVVALCRPY